MARDSGRLERFSDLEYLYLTTIGRNSGMPREIEIWFVIYEDKIYIGAEHFHRANWVKNLLQNPSATVRIGDAQFAAIARVLDQDDDKQIWNIVQHLSRDKYGWGGGLPVELSVRENQNGA